MIYNLAYKIGDLSEFNPEHIHLQNPIWQKPYIELDNGDLFAPLAQLIFSFPFLIMEGMMKHHPMVEKAYSKARSKFLEEAVFQVAKNAMPSAQVYPSVLWDDPDTGQVWENDVVALIGNFIILFEAKSGRINDAARRGGAASLEKNFKELFIEPGEQAWRLQRYLDRFGPRARLRLKSDGSPVPLDLVRPKIVFKFSICIESLASLTSAKFYLKELGLVTNDTAWAPVLSLGDLLMVEKFLDSEVSFVHYMSRRAVLEEQFSFDGDEQDLLSMYLTNGLCLDPSKLDGRRVIFHDSDSLVRKPKQPRSDRRVFELHGVQTSPLWMACLKELYHNQSLRHRFDAINVVLNQYPPALFEFERRIRRWRRGESHKGQDVFVAKYSVAGRLFLLATHLVKKMPPEHNWREIARELIESFTPNGVAADCVVICFARSPKETFSGFSFFRLLQRTVPGAQQERIQVSD